MPQAGGTAPPADAHPQTGGVFGGRRRQLELDNQHLRNELEASRLQAANFQLELLRLRESEVQLNTDLAELRAEVSRVTGLDPHEMETEVAGYRAKVAQARQQADTARRLLAELGSKITEARSRLVQTEELTLLQEAGLYEYAHPLDDAVAHKARLAILQDRIKVMARGDNAIVSSTGWTINGSVRDGQAMIRDFSKLMLRAYNAEADNCVRTVRPHRLHSATERLTKVRDTIARLGKRMDIRIADDFHRARIEEIRLTADHIGKVDEDKERVRAERERQREEDKARREFEREKARLAKEHAHYLAALSRMHAIGATQGTETLEEKITEIEAAIAGVEAREANTRAGYVYVISNIGAFGQKMVKIGMTRRLEPQDRVRELGDASVPFRFDTHALIFSEDAIGLESQLHAHFTQRRVNLVNTQREFFYATPDEVRTALEQFAGQHLLEYREYPEAIEWRASTRREHQAQDQIPNAAAVP